MPTNATCCMVTNTPDDLLHPRASPHAAPLTYTGSACAQTVHTRTPQARAERRHSPPLGTKSERSQEQRWIAVTGRGRKRQGAHTAALGRAARSRDRLHRTPMALSAMRSARHMARALGSRLSAPAPRLAASAVGARARVLTHGVGCVCGCAPRLRSAQVRGAPTTRASAPHTRARVADEWARADGCVWAASHRPARR